MDADNLLGVVLSVIDELLRRFGGEVYGIDFERKHEIEALMIAFNRLAREMSPRPQPADLDDDEVVKALARTAAAIDTRALFVLADENAPPEDQLLHDVANVVLEALAECGERLQASGL